MKKFIFFFGTMLFAATNALPQITGSVKDRTGKALPNVTITAADVAGKLVATINSRERGYYEFNGLQPGKYKIVAKFEGFRTAAYKIEVKQGDTGAVEGADDLYNGTWLDIILSTDMVYYQIEGQVIDQKEKGQPNITITSTDTSGKVVATVKSGNLGFFGFKGLQPGKHKIEAKAAGFRPAVYRNVVVNEKEPGPKGEEDIDEATWLYVVLRPVK